MTTMQTLLQRAIRKTRARGLGDSVDAAELGAALEDAQALFLTLTGRALTDVWITDDYEAGEDERVSVDPAETVTVSLPDSVTDTATGQPRAPRNGAIIEICGAAPAKYIYVSMLGGWQELTDLALTSQHPFGPNLDDAVADMLAARFCDSIFQREPSGVLLQLASQGRSAFEAAFTPILRLQSDPGLLNETVGIYYGQE